MISFGRVIPREPRARQTQTNNQQPTFLTYIWIYMYRNLNPNVCKEGRLLVVARARQDIPEYELALPVNNMCIREGRETLFIPSRINMLLTSKSAQGLSIGP